MSRPRHGPRQNARQEPRQAPRKHRGTECSYDHYFNGLPLGYEVVWCNRTDVTNGRGNPVGASPISRMLPGSLAERRDAHQHSARTSTRYSITWSARPSTDGGIVSPSALAVFSRVEDWRVT